MVLVEGGRQVGCGSKTSKHKAGFREHEKTEKLGKPEAEPKTAGAM